ncbi:MAG: RIP metalloprotease RseP [bacterium]|nr:RIP metalloprotease RseP [bacterium]
MGVSAAAAFLGLRAESILPVAMGVIALGVVVFIHELGHFIVAKLSGIRVEVFSIGFPPRLWGFKRGETEYRISWIFFGGYVKLAGMEYEEGADPRSVRDGYYASSIGTRILVCACGPLMNILSAFLIYSFLYAAGFPVPSNMESTVIGSVLEGSPAGEAGLRPGDRVVRIDGRAVRRWEDVTRSIVLAARSPIEVEWERGGERFAAPIEPERDERLMVRRIGILPTDLISVDVLEGSPAAAAGVRDGDFIVSVDGEPAHAWDQLVERIRARAGVPVMLGLLRAGAPLDATVVPTENPELGHPAIGVRLRQDVSMDDLKANGFIAYVHRDPFSWIAGNVREMYLTLRGLVARAISPRGLAGPIGIVQIMSYSVRAGPRQFLFVIAFISVNLAVINLLPVPVLDGGHILLTVVEGVRRRPLGARFMTTVQNIFMTVLVALMLLIFANDIMRTWGGAILRLIGGGAKTPAGETATPAPLPGP